MIPLAVTAPLVPGIATAILMALSLSGALLFFVLAVITILSRMEGRR